MRRRAYALTLLVALALGSACGGASPSGLPPAAAAPERLFAGGPISERPLAAPESSGSSAAQSLGPSHRIGDAVRAGDLLVTLVDGQARGGAVEAHFLIRNVGQDTAIVSPGNFRLFAAGSRPRMRLREPATPLPIGELRPGESIQGTVTWDVSPVDFVRVAFASEAGKVEWMVTSAA